MKTSTTSKKKDENRKRNVIMNFRVSPEEKERIEERIALSGLMKSEYFINSCLDNKVIAYGLTVDGEIKTPERDSLSVLEYKAEMRKQEIQKLETQEKELRGTLHNLQSLIKQAEEKLEEAKKEAASIIESAKAKANEWLEKINIRLGLIPKKDIEDKRRELVGYYKACEPYLTNDMRMAINNEDVKGFGALVSRLTASNPDGTVARRDPGWEELFDFEIKFEEYLEMKKKNVKTEDIHKELNKPELHNRMKR